MPIGGADMPVVISLLNSYAGLAAAATGFAIDNKVLIIAGALGRRLGLSPLDPDEQGHEPLVRQRAVRRVGRRSAPRRRAAGRGQDRHPLHGRRRRAMLDNARSVIVVPGYGMAVAQAQHQVQELAEMLIERGGEVRYAIHPVAGRMPGHMNVLLAEANVPYDLLMEMEQINDDFPNADVALVVGANDVVNPAARYKKDSPHLRHADPERRPGADGHRPEAEHEAGLCRRGQRAVLRSRRR